MGKAPDRVGRVIPFREIESGMMAGLWHAPVGGFDWRDDLRPAVVDENSEVGDPPVPSWWLVPREGALRRYAVLGKVNLARDFARLGIDPTRPAILTFANRYGHLGSSTPLLPRGQKPPHPIVFAITGGSSKWGESLELWQEEALGFRLLWETWELAVVTSGKRVSTNSQVERARQSLRDRFSWDADGSIRYLFEIAGGGTSRRWFGFITDPTEPDHEAVIASVPKGDLAAAARYWVIKQVNQRLRGKVNPTILPLRNAEVRFVPEDLLAAVYLRLGIEISEGLGQLRECAGCSQPFAATRRDQMYCGKNCRERASYRRRTGGPGSERDIVGAASAP